MTRDRRSQPITKSLPKGTLLEALVNNLLQQEYSDDWQQNSDPMIRGLGVCSAIKREPRVWVLPKAFFVEEVLLPIIERLEGPEAANKLRSVPGILDHYADLLREKAKRDAPARDRLPPTPNMEAYVTMVVTAVLYCDWEAGKSLTSQYVRTARLLGIERNAVRRIAEKFQLRVNGADAEHKELLFATVLASKNMIWTLPEMVKARGKSRANVFAAPGAVSSGFEHDTAQSFAN